MDNPTSGIARNAEKQRLGAATARERLLSEAEALENRARKAEEEGRVTWASRYRQRAQRCRTEAGGSEAARFFKLSAEAEQRERWANDAHAKGDSRRAADLRRAAAHLRKDACGFDHEAAWREVRRPVERVALGLNSDSADALAALGVPRNDYAAFLTRVVEEALCAIQDSRIKLGSSFRLDAVPSQHPRHDDRRMQAIEQAAEIQFRLIEAQHRAATFGE